MPAANVGSACVDSTANVVVDLSLDFNVYHIPVWYLIHTQQIIRFSSEIVKYVCLKVRSRSGITYCG